MRVWLNAIALAVLPAHAFLKLPFNSKTMWFPGSLPWGIFPVLVV